MVPATLTIETKLVVTHSSGVAIQVAMFSSSQPTVHSCTTALVLRILEQYRPAPPDQPVLEGLTYPKHLTIAST